MKKPIKSTAHGVIDYIFAAAHFFVPEIIGVREDAYEIFAATGAAITVNDAITDTAVGLIPALSLKEHQVTDAVLIAGMTLVTFSKPVREDKKALIFHLCVLASAYAYFALSDYDSPSERKR